MSISYRNFYILVAIIFLLSSCTRGGNNAELTDLPQAVSTNQPTQEEANEPGTVSGGATSTQLIGSHDGVETRATESACLAFGWVVGLDDSSKDASVRVLVDGVEVAQTEANQYRPDLDAEGRCLNGTCAFEVNLWDLITRNEEHSVLVQGRDVLLGEWIDLSGSPKKLICVQPLTKSQTGSKAVVSSDPSGRFRFETGQIALVLEFLDDDLLHFEYSSAADFMDLRSPMYTTPMVVKTDYPGPKKLLLDDIYTFVTTDLTIQVNPATLCVTATDITRDPDLMLTTLCPQNLGFGNQGISLTPESYLHAYGLGQEFVTPGSADGDWIGRVRNPGGPYGNAMVEFLGGGVGNIQFPVVYFAGNELDNYALFADNLFRQRWDFTGSIWKVDMGGERLRFYLMSGPDLQDLRKDYMELTGRPPVPPKKMFGMWISEYGYDNWAELDGKLTTLRANKFPVDGFVLDLQWFGGIQSGSDNTRMGSLSWDLVKFPNPGAKIADLQSNQGLGIITIEESYIGRGLDEFRRLESKGYLVKQCESCSATYLDSNPWWGKGGMMDWSNLEAGVFWHDLKREPLINLGVMGHWTDLGEPEMYDPESWYAGIVEDGQLRNKHVDIHNLYNFLWSKSIYEGYQRNRHSQRPMILSRSGTSGSQRLGVSMWSGDIGSNLSSLATHLNAQMHMSMSGMDYFGSDIGGFRRESTDGDINEIYTQWFANSMAFDIPARAHAENLCNCKETAPDRIGDLDSNLANLRSRYELSPYLYSLSHRAYRFGEPIFPPLVYYFQKDMAVREMGNEKMIGRDLLVAVVAANGEAERRVYLPAGRWVNYHTLEFYTSQGEWIGPFSVYPDGLFRLPLFARAGAIIPQMYVDEKSMNIVGKRADGTNRDELVIFVFADDVPSQFVYYEDDGATTAYQSDELRETVLSQQSTSNGVIITIAAASGNYSGAATNRETVIKLAFEDADLIKEVILNGVSIPMVSSQSELDAMRSGWLMAGKNLVIAKSGKLPVDQPKVFDFRR